MHRLLHHTIYSIFVILIILGVFNAYITGISQGLDKKLNYGAENDIYAMSIAISEERYGFDEGYVGRPEVFDTLQNIIAPPGEDALYPGLADNGAIIEQAIQNAASLDEDTFIKFNSVKLPFRVMLAEDTGLVDFYRLSFHFFGYHADATYHFYFTLLSLSILCLLLHARSHFWACGLLLAMVIGFNLLFYTNTFIGRIDAPSVTSNRQLGVLSLIATLHICLFYWMKQRYMVVTPWLLLITQIAILCFVMNVRSSASWQFLAILVWYGGIFGAHLLARKQLFAPKAWMTSLIKRPYILMLVVVLTMTGYYQLYNKERLEKHDFIYFTDCTMPHHLRWHSAYRALTIHPQWHEYAPSELIHLYDGSDNMAWEVGRNYWNIKNPGHSFSCERTGNILLRAHDHMVGKAFRKFARTHVSYMTELFFIYKPKMIVAFIYQNLQSLPHWFISMIVGLNLFLFAAWLLSAHKKEFSHSYLMAMAVTSLLVLCSNAPYLFAYPAYLTETFILIYAFLLICPLALLFLLFSAFSYVKGRHGTSSPS